MADGRLYAVRGNAPAPDATIETDAATLSALLWDGRQLGEALRSGDIEIEGDRAAAASFLSLFPLPEPASLGTGA